MLPQLSLGCERAAIRVSLSMANGFYETTALRLAYDMKLAHRVPLDGSPVALAELAAKTGAPEETIC